MIHSPIFIVGCGRSGTTLLRTMLNHHSQVAIPLESLFIIDYLRAASRVDPDRWQPLFLQEYELAEWGSVFSPEDFEGCETAKDYVDRIHELYMREHGKSVWGQKTPRFVRHGHFLKSVYPDARFIHVIRDPRAVVSSLIRSNVHYSNAYFGAHRWLRDVSAGMKLKQDFPDDVLAVRYEDLVLQSESTLRTICAFLNLAFEPGMMDYHHTGPAEYNGYYAQIHSGLSRAPDRSRIDAWQRHLSPRQVAVIESISAPLMVTWDYAPADAAAPEAAALYFLWLRGERLFGFARQIWHNMTTRRGYLRSLVRRKLALSLFFNTIKDVNY